MIEFTSSMVRLLKGAPLSCLMILLLEGQAVSAQFLERHTGYSDKLVCNALLLLEEHGLATRNGRYSWQIADGVRQLPLMQSLIGAGDEPENRDVCAQTITEAPTEPEEPTAEMVIDVVPEPVENPVENRAGSRRNSESEIPCPSSSSRNLITRDPEKELPLPLDPDRESEIFRVRSNISACDAAGIREPARSRLSRLAHVCPSLIEHHVRAAPNMGAAIYRIEHNWTPQGGGANDRRKYIENDYADCIE